MENTCPNCGKPIAKVYCKWCYGAAYRAATRGRYASYHADYREKNRDRIKLKVQERWAVNGEAYLENARRRNHADPRRRLLSHARARAKELSLPFSLVLDDIPIPGLCPVLQIPLLVGTGTKHDHSPTLDRVDPAGGYVPGNVAVVSERANRIKNNGSAEEHRKIAAFMESWPL